MRSKMIQTGLLGISLISTAAVAETLEQAWTMALANNHQLKAAQADTSASEQQLYSAQGQQLPQVNISSGYTQYNESPAAKTYIGGQTAQFTMQQSGSARAQAMASLPVYTGGRISHGIEAAESALQAAKQQETTTELDLKMQIAESYVAVLRADSAWQVAQTHVETLNAHQRDVQERFAQGIVAKNDVLAAAVELANAEQQRLKASHQRDNAKAFYNRLLSRELTADVTLQTQWPQTPTGDLAQLTQQAFKQRPEVAMLAAQIDAMTQQAESVKADRLPQVALNGGYQYQQNRYQAYEGLWVAGVNMEWKLYDGSTAHKSDALTRQALSLQEQRDDLTSQIGLQVRQAWLEIDETQKRLETAENSITQADENLKVANDRYQQGLSTHTEVLDAQNLRQTSYDNRNNAQYDVILARLRMRRAVGIL